MDVNEQAAAYEWARDNVKAGLPQPTLRQHLYSIMPVVWRILLAFFMALTLWSVLRDSVAEESSTLALLAVTCAVMVRRGC